jgi:ubiquinone/menaquinone biosynthesis C-methylase UbiE
MFKSSGCYVFALMAVLFRVRDAIWPPERVLRELGVSPGHTVLDYGCGPGSYSLAAARLAGPSGKVFAVDINPWAVRRLQNIARRLGVGNIVAIVGDSPAGLPCRIVDLALMHDVLHELDDAATVIVGIERVLKPEGVLAVSDHHMRSSAIVHAVTSRGVFALARCSKDVHCFKRREG